MMAVSKFRQYPRFESLGLAKNGQIFKFKLIPRCESCGEPATHQRRYRDECPTDRGPEIREGWEWLCDDCDPKPVDPPFSDFSWRR